MDGAVDSNTLVLMASARPYCRSLLIELGGRGCAAVLVVYQYEQHSAAGWCWCGASASAGTAGNWWINRYMLLNSVVASGVRRTLRSTVLHYIVLSWTGLLTDVCGGGGGGGDGFR